MIRTIADFLEQLKTKGLSTISENEDVNHPGMIGDMYEGLTKAILEKAIFEGFNLKIVSGKISNTKGEMTNQIDCMIVEGEGRQLPFSGDWVYHYHQVIAVIEVKKNLFTDDLSSSHENLRSVIQVSRTPEKDGENYIIRALRDAWKSMLRTELPYRHEVDSLPEHEQALYHTLLMEAYFPVRIVIGYYGFKTEHSLRQGFYKFLLNNYKKGNVRGFGPGSLPNLIICGNNSIIKNNGMPFGLPFNYSEKYYWNLCVSSNETPIVHLLEFIWTRISYKYKISSSSIFGRDMDYARTLRFIDCCVELLPESKVGWGYKYFFISAESLEEGVLAEKPELPVWEPVFLTSLQFVVLQVLIQKEFLNYTTDTDFIKAVTKEGFSVDTFIDELVATSLVYKKNSEIRFLTDMCAFAILPDGRNIAGENKNGNFTHWINNYMNQNP